MNILSFTSEDKERWDKYVLESGSSSVYHLSGWKEVIENTFGHSTRYLLSENDQKGVQGILPVVQLKSLFFGNYMVSLPYFTYGGVCADGDDIRDELLGAAIAYAQSCNAGYLEMRHTGPMENGMPVKTVKVSMRLPLVNNADDLWKSFPAKLKSQIRRPSKEGLYSKLEKEEELNSFYKVFSINMRDLGTPVYSKLFFRNILRMFPELTWICSVYAKNGNPVASGFLVGFKNLLEIPWASSLRSYNNLSPNMLLYWTVLKFACESGYASFDFGRSTPGEGTYKFKEQWGAQPVRLHWHYWLKNGGSLPELNPRNPKYRAAIEIWRRLPVGLTRLIGPAIVKNLP
ncbi:MAG TPA: FemAB family XrtA/PEP-CTERM system-associated protein [Dissulfurispiraceae bacterium]|nr:FemAB family XrtA/PEP-CTERM system-associated protein [Dissulfurispiraceae bacterium]